MSDEKPNAVERLAEISGGKTELAKLAGVSNSLITRYAKRGKLPGRHRNATLLALRAKLDGHERGDELLREAERLIPVEDRCPCCGADLTGRVV